LLDEDMPELKAECKNFQNVFVLEIDIVFFSVIARCDTSELKVTGFDAEEFTKESLLWEDEETRYFYEELPDLKAFLPSILYKDSAQATIVQANH